MKFKPANKRRPAVERARAAFTLAEVLAALAFMAIVIPTAVEGLHVASRAGVAAHRKSVAARVADRVLNEAIIGGQSGAGARNGTVQEGAQSYRWSVRYEAWPEDAMRLVTVEVTFPVQGQDFDVRLSTLVSNSQ